MADNLIFPIGFDLEKAVEDASKDWDKYAKKLEAVLAKRAVKVKLSLDTTKLDNLEDVKKRLAQIKIEPITPDTRNSIKELAKELQMLAKALEQVQKFSKTNQVGQQNFRNDVALERLRQANERLEIQKRRVALAEQKHAEAMNRSTTASRNLSQSFSEQDGYISRLLKRMAVYAAYSGVNTFLTSVREVTAQFELQRISLGAIIQDQQRANALFAEIKSFALTSPLKILDLTKYTKQVAAYGFEADKLFQTTKMLADISVGLGVDMSRLTLFFGQVYATGYLRASEVRQATEAGIPLVDKLAKKLSEANGKLVSAAEVMDLISKRAISFEQVEEVFQDMTSAGGEFYNMQVKQSQTLFGMWSKLGDAAAIMYDEIGNTQGVNEGMKTLIQTLENLMRNWKDTARWMDVIAGAMVVYAVGLKNATIASAAMTTAEGARLAITNAQVIATPKLVTAIIGQNAATALSTALTKAHTAAMFKHATATNVLSKSFWKLTTAMLANPWVAVAAAITAVGLALFHFIGNTETAADRTEKLNDSISRLNSHKDSTDELINTYEELSSKTERSANEQRKLGDATQELAKRFPDAVVGINKFNNEIEISIGKVKRLSGLMASTMEKDARNNLEAKEKDLTMLENLLVKYDKFLKRGGGTFYDEDMGKVVFGAYLTENDRRDIISRMAEVSAQIIQTKNDITNAKRELGDIPSVDTDEIEKFGAWKKTLTTFRQQVGDVRVSLFDDSTINQFGSLEEALKKTAEEYKKNIALVATYDGTLKSTMLTAEERAKIETERAEADAMATLAKNALEYYNVLSLLEENAGGAGDRNPRSTRRQELLDEIRLVEKLYKEYKDIAKIEGPGKAEADMRRLYAENLRELADKYGIDLPRGVDSYSEAMDVLIGKLRELRRAAKTDGERRNLDIAVRESVYRRDKGWMDAAQEEIEAQLKELAARISRTKTAKEFYEKILGMTGDVELAKSISLSIYGDDGAKLFEQTVEQIKEVFKSGNADVVIDIDAAIDTTNQRINYKMLADIYDKYQNDIIEKNRDTTQKLISEGQKTAASNVSTWEKELAKAKDYEQQRTDIINRETQRRAEIYKSNLPQQEKDRLVAQSQSQQDKEISDLNWKEFKESDDYIKIFENLDNVSTAALKRLRTNLEEVKTANADLSPENMKALVKAMEDIDNQLDERGFGNVMVQSVEDYIQAMRDLKTARAELQSAQAEYDAQEPMLDAEIDNAKQEEIAAQTALNLLKQDELATENQIVAAELRLNTATSNVAKAENKKAQAAEKVKKAEQKVTDQQDKQKKATSKFFKDMQQVAQTADQLANELSDVKELLGLSEDSAAGLVFDSAVSGLQAVSKAIAVVTAAQAIYNAVCMSNPYIAAAAGVLAVFSAIGSFLTSNKVRKANKEIERQQELLDQLEYTYKRLGEESEKVFGADYVNNYNERLKALQAEQTAYERQARAERSKGKKKDKAKIKEYENAARDTADEIKKMEQEVAERMTGTDVASAARDFAQAWLEAYATFGNTTDAIKEKFNDMIKNMIVESVMAKTVQMALDPLFDKMNQMYKDGASMTDVLTYAFSQAETLTEDIANGLEVNAKYLESMGVDIKGLYASGDNLKGISRDIATASEESINGLAAHMNTVEWYVAQIQQSVAAIAEQGGESAAGAAVDYSLLIQQSVDRLAMIERYSSEILVECRRNAVAAENALAEIRRVIVPKGTKGTHYVYVGM